jgi:hypothetical protein
MEIVAVKTVDPDQTDVICFKALLIELKVLAHLGSHINLVSFLGACTTQIRESSRKTKNLFITIYII